MNSFLSRHRKIVLSILVVATVLQVAYSVLADSSIETVLDKFRFVLIASIASEAVFVVGLVCMAIAVEGGLGANPFRWHERFSELTARIENSRLFWLGFWLNFLGALSLGVLWFFGIILGLPKEAWGALWLPAMDIFLTLGVRRVALSVFKNE